MKKEIPILFSTPMVQAILAGRKTMTRRTRGLEFEDPSAWQPVPWDNSDPKWTLELTGKKYVDYAFYKGNKDEVFFEVCPYGKPGDILWVRESFSRYKSGEIAFKADKTEAMIIGNPWKPSIHMLKADARIWLEVIDVRVERLQEITEEDAIDEGVTLGKKWFKHAHEFEELWKVINGTDNWAANPWVWVISFKTINRTAPE